MHGVQRHFLGYTSCELCIILEYIYDLFDYFGKENRYEFGYEKMVFNMALGNCRHVFRSNFGPHQYSVNQL